MNNTILDRKINYWEHQLLDLGKRNKMINYRETKRATLKITEPSFSELFQRLAVKEEKLTFQRAIDKETDIRVYSILSLLESLSSPLPVTVGDIGTESSIIERQKTLKHLRSKARLALEEQGTNVLYLSFGFIEWKEGKGTSEKWIKSPLVLVPVVLSLDSLNSPYTLEKHEDDIVVNPTLGYYLSTEYGIDLPDFDDGKESIDEFLVRMEEIADMSGWRILQEVSLGLLSFLKISMYNDLRANEERIKKNPVIRAMAGDTEEANQIPEELNGFNLDSIDVQDCYQVMSADSSQQDAILYSKKNVSFVMQGPPGTGKSQTITNIIAEALADGKKVLFVSEKMAALQVVYHRLQEAHLGDFCLPLHSYKANKKEILEQIGANLRLKQTRVKDTARNSLENLQSIRDEINAYAKELHQVIEPLNMSCYEVYGKLDEVREAPIVSFSLDKVSSLSQSDLSNLLGLIKKYSLAVRGLNYYIKDNPWDGVVVRAFGYDEKEQFARCLENAIVLSECCSEQLSLLKECGDMVSVLNCHQLTIFCDDLLSVVALPQIPAAWLRYENTDFILTKVVTASERYGNMKSLRKQVTAVFCDDVFSFDYNGWETGISELFSQIEKTRFLSHHNHGSIYENAEILSSQLRALSDEVSAFEGNIGKIESLLDTKLLRSKTGIDFANGLFAIIKDNQLLPQEWLLSDIDTVRQTAIAAKALAHEIKTSEQTLLESWVKEILTYDYLPVLQRFKTDYTRRFMISNQQYCADKKGIQALSSTVIKELTDEDILDILNKLKQYHEKLDLFNNDTSEYAKALGNNFTGLDSDWDSIIEIVKQTALTAKALAYEIKISEQTLLQSWEKEILTYDYLPVLQRFKTDYIGWLKIFNQQYRRDKKSIQALSSTVIKKLTDETALDILNQLKHYHEKLDLFNNNASEYLMVLGDQFTGLDSDWDRIIDTVTQITFTAKAQAHEIKKLEQVLLQSWEKEILTYDYLPVLGRYKTDYTELFKVLYQQYRTDKKSIHSLLINDSKELTDYDILDILNRLKLYHEKLDLFNNADEYVQVLGKYFTGLDSDWDNILRLVAICDSVQQQFKGQVSKKTAEALSCNHQEFNNAVSSLANKASTALSNVQNIVADNPFNPDFSASEIQTQEIVSTAAVLISLLNKISAQKTRIKTCLIQPDTGYEMISQGIEKLNAYVEVSNIIKSAEPEYAELFDFLFQNEDTNWKNIISLDKQYRKTWLLQYYSYVHPFLNASVSRRGEVSQTANHVKSVAEQLQKELEWIDERFMEPVKQKQLSILDLLRKLKNCENNFDWLEKWIDYQEAKSDCYQNGLENYIEAIETAGTFYDIESSFLKGFYQMWLGEAYTHLPAVRRFRRNVQDDRIEEFSKLDDYQLKIAQMRIREKLIDNLPTTSRLLKGTDEITILNKELSKKRRIMPLRKLFRQIPNLLLKLKPCLMMSPLSVSYFLETEAYNFDMVIFDEASQIFPEDAIGAIFRGAQVIIAGDSKQLPPTNFFAAATNNLYSDYDIDDDGDADFAESISDSVLEETASALPNRTLLWHYRSKHESLISFSNREIYKNTLITFPNSSDAIPEMGVEYVYVPDGYYEGGGKNCNILEAQKCVELVEEHIRNHSERSLGIIAFSEKQQTAIENAIMVFREENPLYEYFFNEAVEEPFFIKNLENVQGDERDTIIFSICYAKDRNGRMFMRFGPLGHEGGERRLNVAITRAKCNVKLVGSILPSDIDLNRTKSEGIRMLRSYIEFALSNSASGNSHEKVDEFTATDEFCDEVAAFLIEKGYQIQRRIGCSDYRIDIAVENPNVKDDFIAGIECDGISYVQANTARDRDHLRRKVLENMGWNMYRVWSTEWIKHPDQEKQALVDFLESLISGKGQSKHELKTSIIEEDDTSIEEIAVEQKRKEKEPSANPYGFAYYKEANWRETEYPNRFDNDTRIADSIMHIVREEQPIHLEMLYKRLGSSFTARKATSAVKYTIDLIIKCKLKGRVQIEDQFVRLLPIEPITVRIPKQYDTPRPMEYIHDEEVALAMVEIVRNSYGLSQKDLATECARVFGFERQGQKIKAKTQAAFSLLIDKGYAKIVDGKVYLTGGN